MGAFILPPSNCFGCALDRTHDAHVRPTAAKIVSERDLDLRLGASAERVFGAARHGIKEMVGRIDHDRAPGLPCVIGDNYTPISWIDFPRLPWRTRSGTAG